MNRIIYVAGVNRKHLAAAAQNVPYWLLSATLLRKYPKWLDAYMTPNRHVMWDPGTFTEDCISYKYYRQYIKAYAKPWHTYLQYDEIGDSEATLWYLRDMRNRGFNPIPVLQGESFHLLRQEKLVAIGGLVKLKEIDRINYLNTIFYEHKPTAKIHLLGMMQHKWFEPYEQATQGDNTSWIPRSEWNRKKTIEQWLKEYGEQWIEHKQREYVQTTLFN